MLPLYPGLTIAGVLGMAVATAIATVASMIVWRRRFAADPDLVGRQIQLEETCACAAAATIRGCTLSRG